MINEAFRIKVNSREESKYIQEILFSHSSRWRINGTNLLYGDDNGNDWEGIYHYPNGKMTADINSNGRHFREHENPEITLEEFRSLYDSSDPLDLRIQISKRKMLEFAEYYCNNIVDAGSSEQLLNNFLDL